MVHDRGRRSILLRRAGFVAAALAGLGAGCREPTAPPKSAPPPTTEPLDAGPVAVPSPPSDRDGDGVPDEHDQCPDSPGPKESSGCPMPCLSVVMPERIIVPERIHFASGKALLGPNNLPPLDTIALVLKEYPHITLEVDGHTDSLEPPLLGLERAKVVRDYLVAKGTAPARLTVKGFGPKMPRGQNTKEGREQNRRVEFTRTDTGTPGFTTSSRGPARRCSSSRAPASSAKAGGRRSRV